jgi:protein-disulfide isomerase
MRPPCSSVFGNRKLFPNKEQVARDLTPTAAAKLLFRNVIAGLVFTGLILLSSSSRAQQQSTAELKDLKKEIESSKTGQMEIQKELQEIKKSLLARPAANPAEPPREIVINTEGAPFKGKKNAKLKLIEFSDYQCPFCSRYVQETLPQIEKDCIKTGKLKYVFRDFPRIHSSRCVSRLPGSQLRRRSREILGNA